MIDFITKEKANAYYSYNTQDERDKKSNAIVAYAAENGYELDQFLFDKKGDGTYGFDKLLKHAISSNTKTLIIPDYDSLGCDKVVCWNNYLMLRKHQIKPVLIDGNLPTREIERHLYVIKNYNSYGVEWRVRYGEVSPIHPIKISDGRTPFGYNNVNGYAVVNPDDAKIVREIFEQYANEVRTVDIVNDINAKYGKSISRSSILPMVSNPRYAGAAAPEKGSFPPIITNGLWLKVCTIRDKRRLDQPDEHVFILSSVCMDARGGSQFLPYQSYGRFASTEYRCEDGDRTLCVDANRLEGIVQKAVCDYLLPNLDDIANTVVTEAKLRSGLICDYMTECVSEKQGHRNDILMACNTLQAATAKYDILSFDHVKFRVGEVNYVEQHVKLDHDLYGQDESLIRAYFDRAKLLMTLGREEQRYFIGGLAPCVYVKPDEVIIVMFGKTKFRVSIEAKGIIKTERAAEITGRGCRG